jgi:NCS1 family nucleobase:cation symporter-1
MDTAVRGVESDAFLKVESHGIDAIPAADRHGRPRELGFLWAGAFVNYASLLTASLLTTYYGLGVWDGLIAVALGTVAGAVILGLLSNTGPASGLPQIAFTRRIFGASGANLGALLTLFLAVGWFAVDTVIAALAGVQLLQLAGVAPDLAGRLLFPWVVVIAAVSIIVAVYGHQTIKVFETWGAIAFATLSVLLFAFLASQVHWSQGPTAAGADYPAAFVLGAMSCFALVASWYPFASDYSRYLPEGSPRRSVTLWPLVGVTIPMLVLGLFGLLLPTIDPKLAADQGVLAVITKHVPPAVAVPFFAFVVLGEIWANYLDVYTAGLVTLTMGLRLRRWQTALLCGVAGTVLAALATTIFDFHTLYEDFLILTYLWAPAWAAVVLLSFFVVGDARPVPALFAWILGTLLSLAFVNYANLFSNASQLAGFRPNQGLVNALHGADLSGLVSVLVAAGAYLLLRRLRAAPQVVGA